MPCRGRIPCPGASKPKIYNLNEICTCFCGARASAAKAIKNTFWIFMVSLFYRYYVFDFMFDFYQISHHELPRVASSRNSSWSPLRVENNWRLQGQLQNHTLLTLKSIWTDIRGQNLTVKSLIICYHIIYL